MKKAFSNLCLLFTTSIFLLNANCSRPQDSENVVVPQPTFAPKSEELATKNDNSDSTELYSTAVARNVEKLSQSSQNPLRSGYSSVSRRCLSKDCQNRFVSVIIAGANSTAMCSGVPLAKNLVLTNFHCINSLAFDPSKNIFTAGVYALSPMYKSDIPQAVMVKKVLAHSPLNYFSPKLMGHPYSMDYAILELESDLEIIPPKVNYAYGFNDGENYTVLEFSPYASGEFDEKRTLREYKCKAIHNSIYGPAAKSKSFPVSFFSDCPIGPGNSGSPIYNRNGELVGIIAGQINPMTIEYLSQFSIDLGILKSRLKNVGWGNMLTCLPKIENGVLTSNIGSNCDSDLSDVASKNIAIVPQNKTLEMESRLAKLRSHISIFEMTPTPLRVTRLGFLYGWVLGPVVAEVPRCIRRENWNQNSQPEQLVLKSIMPKLDVNGQYNDDLFEFDFPVYLKFEDLEKLAGGKKAKLKIFSGITGNLKSDPPQISKPDKYEPKQLIYDSEISFCE